MVNIKSDHQTDGLPQVDYIIYTDPLGTYHKQRDFIQLNYSKFCFWQEFSFDNQLSSLEDCML